MRLDSDQLEWIVREVVRRLRGEAPGSPVSGQPTTANGKSVVAASLPADVHITLTQTLITTATLEHRLEGVARVNVPQRAVVTPAARDLLKERNIELMRNASTSTRD